jgi:hypothetical protein
MYVQRADSQTVCPVIVNQNNIPNATLVVLR